MISIKKLKRHDASFIYIIVLPSGTFGICQQNFRLTYFQNICFEEVENCVENADYQYFLFPTMLLKAIDLPVRSLTVYQITQIKLLHN